MVISASERVQALTGNFRLSDRLLLPVTKFLVKVHCIYYQTELRAAMQVVLIHFKRQLQLITAFSVG